MATEGKDARRLNREARRLLLLASRDMWNDAQKSTAAELAARVDDWDSFCDVASRSLGVCLVWRSLSSLAGGSVLQPVLDRMRGASYMYTLGALHMEATLLEFLSDCLAPLGIRHAFFKGMPLAHRYYATPTARPCRDIDVLIDPKAASEVVHRALALGYVPIEDVGQGKSALATWVRRRTVYPMRAPNGVLVEIHRSLDHGDGLFDVRHMLSRTDEIDFRGRALSVLNTSDLFAYVSMHHTRHFWSHLHWYADLDAMIRHPQFNLAEVRNVAAHVRLAPTVEACLHLNDYARTGDWPEPLSTARSAGEALLARSVECLEGGREREDALRVSMLSDDRAFAWQVTTTERMALFVRKHGRRLVFGLPRRLRAWFKALRSGTKPRGQAEG